MTFSPEQAHPWPLERISNSIFNLISYLILSYLSDYFEWHFSEFVKKAYQNIALLYSLHSMRKTFCSIKMANGPFWVNNILKKDALALVWWMESPKMQKKKMHENVNDKLNIQVIQWRIGAVKSHYSLSLDMSTQNTQKEKTEMLCCCFTWMPLFLILNRQMNRTIVR